MPLTNQRVADEIATLLARRRHELDGARDELRAAEEAAAAKNEEIRQAAEQRTADVCAQTDTTREDQQPQNAWSGQRANGVDEIHFGLADEEDERPAPPRAPATSPTPAASADPVSEVPDPPAVPRQPSRRRPEPVFDDEDDDFSNQTWLR